MVEKQRYTLHERTSRAGIQKTAGVNKVFVHLVNALVVGYVLVPHLWSKAIPRIKVTALLHYACLCVGADLKDY